MGLFTTVLALGVLGVAAAVTILAIGTALPVGHRAESSRDIAAPPDEVWDVISRFEDYPRWRSGLRSVERAADFEGRTVWREIGAGGDTVEYETVEVSAPSRLVRRIRPGKLPYGGSWRMDIAGEGNRTRVTVVENGEVYSPLFRFVSRFVLGHSRSIRSYLDELERFVGTRRGEVSDARPRA